MKTQKTTFNKENRTFKNQWSLTGESRNEGAPTLQLTTSFNKDYKEFRANLSYVEIRNEQGYNVLNWQSDWDNFTIKREKVARYSVKGLEAFLESVLEELGQIPDERVVSLLSRIQENEVAA